jgi:PAS domain S-box-containing protein
MAKRAAAPATGPAISIGEAPIGVGVLSPADQWMEANPYLCGLLGYSREEMVGLARTATTHPEDRAAETSQLDSVRSGAAKSVHIEQRYRTKLGDAIWVNVLATREKPGGKGAGNLVLVVQDISVPRVSVRALRIQQLVSRLLVAAPPGEEAIEQVLAEVASALDWSYAAFWRVDKDGSAIRAVRTWSRPGYRTAAFDRETLAAVFHLGEGVGGKTWETGRPFWESDMVEHSVYPRSAAAKKVGLHSAFAFPIMTAQGVLGIMEFFGEDALSPDRALLEAAEGVGYQLGEFLEKNRATVAGKVSDVLRASIIDVALDCIITSDHQGVISEFNPAAEATFGYKKEDVIGGQMVDLIIPPAYRERHLRGMERYLKTGEAHVLGRRIEITGMRSDGSEFPVELAIMRVPIEGPPFFTAYLRDLTERKRLEAEQSFLLRASEQLASSLDYETTIASIAQLAVPDFADWCVVDVLGRDRHIKRVAVAHKDPEKVRYVDRLREKYPDDPDAEFGVARVLRTGEAEFATEIPESLLAQAARDKEHLEILKDLGLRSYMVIPLRVRGATFGALTLVYAESERRYGERDLKIMTELARLIGIAIENARLLQESEEARHELEQQAAEMEVQATEMEQAQEQMALANKELQALNEQLREKTAEVRGALKQAEEANRAKSDFLATMSHELRTPLNAISGYAELLSMGIRGPVNDAQKADLDRINRSQAHLLGIINDILKFAKLESGQLEMRIEEFPVDAALAAAEDLVRPQLDAKRINYRYVKGDKNVTVRSDRERFQQILLNLLANAVKFTPDEGAITVSWEEKGEQVLTHVTDTGIGVAADQIERIFDPFVQVDASTTRRSEGVGLGLAISRDLARQMGGNVTVTSRDGHGSTFTVALPRGG